MYLPSKKMHSHPIVEFLNERSTFISNISIKSLEKKLNSFNDLLIILRSSSLTFQFIAGTVFIV